LVWAVKVTEEYATWFTALIKEDLGSAFRWPRPSRRSGRKDQRWAARSSDRLKGSRIHHLKELRPGSGGRSEVRITFPFDPARSALLLLGGDKAGNWQRWYRRQHSAGRTAVPRLHR